MKKLIIIIFMLIGWMSGYGQDQKGNNTRSSNYIEINDFTGFESPCKDDLEIIAGEVKTLLQTGGADVKIIVAKIYPPSVYMKKEAGASAMAEVTKKNVADQYSNHILILAQFNEGEKLDIEIIMKLPDASMPSSCHSNISVLQESLNKSIKEKLGQGSNGMANVECTTKDILTTFKEKVQTGCTMDGNDRRAWFEAQGFESRKLGPLKLHLGSNFRDDKIINDKRNVCGTIDYSQGELKYSVSGSGLALISNLVSDDVQTPFARRLIITDQKVSTTLYKSIYNAEMITPSCEVTIWLHFEKGFEGGEDEVFIMIARQNKPPSTSGCYTYNSLHDKYRTDPNFLNSIPRIDFRFHSQKDEIISLISAMNNNPYIPSIESAEAYAGLICGFFDGAIQTIDFIQVIATAANEFNKTSNPLSSIWWADLYSSMNEKRNFYEAFNAKWGETYKDWNNIFTKVGTFLVKVSFEPYRQMLVEMFYEAIIKVVGKFIDNLLFHGDFETNYTIGKLMFDFIPLTAYAKVGKGASSIVGTGDDVLRNMSKNIGESLDAPAAESLLKDAALDLSQLLAKLGTRTNLVYWFKNGMPKGVKVELAKHIDDADFLNKLDIDLGNPKWTQDIKDLITAKPSDLTDKYKLLKDDAGRAWEVAGSDPSWSNWAKRTFFKDVCGKAKLFEDGVSIQAFKQLHGLIDDQIVKQVTLEVNGIKVRFDFISKDASGKFHFGEAKFTTKNKNWNNEWLDAATVNQKQVLPLFQNGGVNSIVVKATDADKLTDLAKIGLSNNSSINIANVLTVKLFGSGADNQIVQTVVNIK